MFVSCIWAHTNSLRSPWFLVYHEKAIHTVASFKSHCFILLWMYLQKPVYRSCKCAYKSNIKKKKPLSNTLSWQFYHLCSILSRCFSRSVGSIEGHMVVRQQGVDHPEAPQGGDWWDYLDIFYFSSLVYT